MKNLFVIIFLFCIQSLYAQHFDLRIENNVFFYRNIKNHFAVTYYPQDSIGPISVTSNISGLKSTGIPGEFTFTPQSDIDSVYFTVSGKILSQKFQSQRFEVELRDLPPTKATINNKTLLVLNREEIEGIELKANIPNFDYSLKLKVIDFKLIVGSEQPIKIIGNKMTKSNFKDLKKLKSGQFLIIKEINVEAIEGYYGESKIFKADNPIVIELK